MHRVLTAIALLTASLPAGDIALPGKKIPAIALLPDGSELKGVMVPRYDENHQLVGVLKSGGMTLLSAREIAGKRISIEFFNPDQTPRGRIDLASAIFDQEKGLLAATEPVEIVTPRLSARGSGLHYSFTQGRGYLTGPATTTLQNPTETTMNSPFQPLRAAALLGLTVLPLAAAPPPEISSAEKAALRADAVTRAPQAAAGMATAKDLLATDLADADAASRAATSFLVQASIPPPAASVVPPAQPLDVKPGPADTVIHCEGGMYFDSDEGVLVYLKNVTVKDPRFNLSGADELKIFLGKKPAAPDTKTTAAADGKPGIGANFGDVERIVANGVIKLDQKAVAGKDPIQASAAVFSYNVKQDLILLSGGYPWVIQGKQAFRATQPNLVLRLSPKTGEMRTEGAWDTILNLEQKPKP